MMPDLTPIFHLAMFGLFCGALIVIAGGGWLAYHLFKAVSLYLGAG